MRKIAASLLAALAVVAGVTVAQAPVAEAAGRHCVTLREFHQVHRGMKKRRVHRIFDTRGEFADGFAGGYTRWYVSCMSVRAGGGDVGAYISYNGRTRRVVEKRFF